MLKKDITFCGLSSTLSCDGNCDKAWGMNGRPRDEHEQMLTDSELGIAPEDPGTYEGGEGKHPQSLNKWCARECERSTLTRPDEKLVLPTFDERSM